jgi:hypothetical protein
MLNAKSSLFFEEERVAELEPPWEVNKDNLNCIIFALITFNHLVTIFSKVSKLCVISKVTLQTYLKTLRIHILAPALKYFRIQ